MRTIVISDVSLGYGTPQILRFANSFAKRYGGEVLILEPDQPERPRRPIASLEPGVRVERIFTALHPYSGEGTIEYVLMVNAQLEAFKPDVLIGASHMGLRVCATANLPPHCINIFYCLEDPGSPSLDDCTIPRASELWDLVIYPEENRARIYSEQMKLKGRTPTAVVYNANDRRSLISAKERNGKFFYGGLIHNRLTLAQHFPKLRDMPVDAYGNVDGFETEACFRKEISGTGVRYMGYLRADDDFFDTLARYAYSIVGWMPVRNDYFNAAPNKFFDAIACGVPPIAAPHPQCVEVINKWKCGLLLEDWSFASFRNALKSAENAYGSDFYDELVSNCQRAMDEELSWDLQFDKVSRLIDRAVRRPRAAQKKGLLSRVFG